MTIKELRKATGMTQQEFAYYLEIPKRTIEDWERERRVPPPYIPKLIERVLEKENTMINEIKNL